jgi:hypothetical protein
MLLDLTPVPLLFLQIRLSVCVLSWRSSRKRISEPYSESLTPEPTTPRLLPTRRFLKPQAPPNEKEILPAALPRSVPAKHQMPRLPGGRRMKKQRLKQIDTSKQSQPNIDQFFMTSS